MGAKALMIQGTGSGAGKSLIVAALCRIFSNMGIKVAPFKSQNMALNSSITRDGGEIGRAQALQAEAARAEATTDMNPVLLKAAGEMGVQVILQGKVHATMSASEYYRFRDSAWMCVTESFSRLRDDFELILIEGAGSPAEINLMDVDIANMAVARLADAPVIIVGDIDRGGVFASIYGTYKLLYPNDRERLKGYFINKFRGDPAILRPGLEMLSEMTGMRSAGVIPYITDIGLPEEDGLVFSGERNRLLPEYGNTIRVVVVRLPYISNFTDFDPFRIEEDVDLIYSRNYQDIENADLLIIPGSKNTIKDLMFLKTTKLDKSIMRAMDRGAHLIGICGGYQMMSKRIYDPLSIESKEPEIEALGFLDVEVFFATEKITSQVEAHIVHNGFLTDTLTDEDRVRLIKGYEIHMGRSDESQDLFNIKRLSGSMHDLQYDGKGVDYCWGTYLHGIFDNDFFRRAVLNKVRKSKGLSPLPVRRRYYDYRSEAIDRLAEFVKQNIDIEYLMEVVNL